MPPRMDEPVSIDELTGEPNAASPRDPGYDAWEEEQLRDAIRDLNENPEGDLTHEEVFARFDAIIAKYERR
ncbi:MAG: hypothetical protein GVY13_10935 [Alphaproteobacteria bacterium]|nr:hypothetical protein [Alphaproteobacteria bacterium]